MSTNSFSGNILVYEDAFISFYLGNVRRELMTLYPANGNLSVLLPVFQTAGDMNASNLSAAVDFMFSNQGRLSKENI